MNVGAAAAPLPSSCSQSAETSRSVTLKHLSSLVSFPGSGAAGNADSNLINVNKPQDSADTPEITLEERLI